MDVSTDLLGTFVAVCQEQSFSKAARKVFRSQAAVSIQIATLEERAGLQFFDRGERPLRLTESGRLFLDFSLEFLNKLEGLDRLLRELASGVSGEVKVAASTSVGTYLLPDIVADILKKSPKLKITILVQPARQICESVRSADQDFGIILAHKPPHNLISKPLKKEPGCIIAPAGHPLADKKTVTTRDLRCVAFIAEEKEGHWDSMTNRFLRQHRLSNASVALRVKDNYQAMKEAVRAGLGVAVLPKFIVKRELYDGTFCELNLGKKWISLFYYNAYSADTPPLKPYGCRRQKFSRTKYIDWEIEANGLLDQRRAQVTTSASSVWAWSTCSHVHRQVAYTMAEMESLGEPDKGNPHVRFYEG